jgi:hypothetical protein
MREYISTQVETLIEQGECLLRKNPTRPTCGLCHFTARSGCTLAFALHLSSPITGQPFLRRLPVQSVDFFAAGVAQHQRGVVSCETRPLPCDAPSRR